MILALVTALLLATNADRPSTVKQCGDAYTSHYEALLLGAIADQVAIASAGPSEGEEVRAALDTDDPAVRVILEDADELVDEKAVARSCQRANRSQYECVADARAYQDLASCRLKELPLVDPAALVVGEGDAAGPRSGE